MKQKQLAKWLKFVIVTVGVLRLIGCGIVTMIGTDFSIDYPEFANRLIPWVAFIWAAAIPGFIALVFAWRIACSIQKDNTFSETNAKLLKRISVLELADAIFIFVGSVAYLLLDISHPSVLIASMVAVFLEIAVSVVAAVLSHSVQKAASLQEQSELTI